MLGILFLCGRNLFHKIVMAAARPYRRGRRRTPVFAAEETEPAISRSRAAKGVFFNALLSLARRFSFVFMAL